MLEMYYNIPSNNRELQLGGEILAKMTHYNIPSNNRELQPHPQSDLWYWYYNIPSNNRELQHNTNLYILLRIITYQVITGNYSR